MKMKMDETPVKPPPHRPAVGTVSGKRIERVKLAEALWVRGFKKWQILDAMMEQFGIARGTARNDFGYARRKIRAEANIQSKGDMQKRVGDGYLDIIRSPISKQSDKIKAWEAFSKLYGLNESMPLQTTPAEVEVKLVDWRQEFQNMKDERMILSAKGTNGTAAQKPNEN